MRKRVIAAILAGTVLAGCSGPAGHDEYGFNKSAAGGLLGGVGGAVAGAQFGKGRGQLAATAAGALLGAFIGSEMGRSLDRADEAYAYRAHHQATMAPIGQQIAWSNPETGHSGTVTPMRDGRIDATGEYCREFHHTVQVGGQWQEAYGIACRQPDGSWRIVQ